MKRRTVDRCGIHRPVALPAAATPRVARMTMNWVAVPANRI